MNSMGTIELDGLEVRLGGRTVLNGLTGVLRGQAIGLLGPNGAGKSTLINTLLGFHRASSGTARVFGLDTYRDRAQIRSGIGYMPENDSFIGNMSGVRFVRYMAELAGLPSAEALERAHEALFYVGLGEVRYRKVNTYSLGMKQLIKLAQALAHGPRLLILDEPTNGLDPMARQRMIHMIQEIRKEGSVRLLISSHLLRDIDETCDEVLILKSGRIAALCNIEEERRSNRNFIELETVGATENILRQYPRPRLRMRMLPGRPHQARHARAHRSPRSLSSLPRNRGSRFAACTCGATRLKTSSCARWTAKERRPAHVHL